jgi:hypothetical protein
VHYEKEKEKVICNCIIRILVNENKILLSKTMYGILPSEALTVIRRFKTKKKKKKSLGI